MSDVAFHQMGNGPVPAPAVPEAVQAPAIIPLRFWPVYRPDPNNAANTIQEDWVEWVKKGEAGGSSGGATTQNAVKRLMPKNGHPGAMEWAVIGPAYEAWKRGEEMPVSGTPLHNWAGIPREMVDALKKFNIYTIEDLADFPDHNIGKIPLPNLREYRNRAKAFVEARQSSDLGSVLAGEREKNERMAEQMAAMREEMDELKKLANAAATLVKGQQGGAIQAAAQPADEDDMKPEGENLVPASAPKRGPGRPRKSEAA